MQDNNVKNLFKVCRRISSDPGVLNSLIEEVETGRQGEVLSSLNSSLSAITAEDLGFTPQNYYKPGFITYSEVYEDTDLSMGLFGMSKGTGFPIHDHPYMIAISAVLQGRMKYRNLDMVSRESPEHCTARTLKQGEVVGPAILYLTPNMGNLHELYALEETVFLDIFMPSYNDHDRTCTSYYEYETGKLQVFQPEIYFRGISYMGKALE